MIRTTLNWTVKNLKTMCDEKDTLSFNHPIQRQSSQWDNEQQSLLIHSILANFPVPSVYVHKMESIESDAKGKHTYSYSVLDGKQRMTTVFSFINGEFSLSENIPDVEIEGELYEIAGKYFEDLDEDVQQEILRFKFNIQSFEDVTNEIIEDIFFRLNNSTPLTKPQKSRPLMGVNNSIFVNEILAGRFFREKCCFTPKQLKNSDDMCTLLQGMMLLDNKYRAYEYTTISADVVSIQYSKYINGNYPDECRDRLKKIIGFLDNVFYIKNKNLKKVNIPILFLVADEALKQSVTGTNFRKWFTHFFENCKEAYGQYCSSGSVKKEKTLGRINVMTESFYSFFQLQDNEPDGQAEDSAETENATGTDFLAELPVDTDNPSDTESGYTAEQEEDADDSGDFEETVSTEQEDTEESFPSDNEKSAEEMETPNESDREEPAEEMGDSTEPDEESTENVDDSTVQEADISEDSAGQNPDGYEQETDESFSDDLQKGADESNDSDFEDAPDAEDVDSEVSSDREDTVANNSFFGTMAAKFHSLVV